MCGDKKACCCQQPEKGQSDPAQCTPEQIRECHGDAAEHPCQCEDCEGASCPSD